ncbi:dethiobiotin synthase [Pseudolabrys taiwanensis]|uniref:ATP-dependent dethiobiotin synthetase BioD n=1 Tax=Pseudolabrys taiwanensis TaxID=331696 RepID=A0A345ZSV8_9HYPH|nr:dethiobiotin synthase [Pseudolabrys taiwanensis]AXK80005.1 dethiobiotin synthase [Pseudolabrys taiwanensis]
MSAYFVTSTGTDIGKTFVTAGLIRYLREAGQSVEALKPVVSGYDSSTETTSDPAVLLKALGRETNAEEIAAMAPWRFRAPLSPDLAAARENRPIDFDALVGFSRAAVEGNKGMLFIEGVGGIMVPIDGQRTVLDWMATLGIPLILVVGGYLGTISHTLTALDVLTQRKLKVAAIVVSESERNPVELDETVASLTRFTDATPVIGLPRLPGGLTQHPAFARIAALL